MFREGSLEIWTALRHIWSAEEASPSVITEVMDSADKLLFGIVLVIFSVTSTCGFLLDLAPAPRGRLPRWIAVNGVGGMKHVFYAVILDYLAVHFATDIAASEAHRDWTELGIPAAILLLAAAMRLLVGGRPKSTAH